MKVCKKCNENKNESDFYSCKKNSDGLFGSCKECVKKRVRERAQILGKDPSWVEYEKKRSREKYHRLGYKDKYKPTKEAKKAIMKRYKEKYPEKQLANNASQRMGKNGLETHHWSYNQEHWKDILHLSVKDHNFLHRYMEYDQERMMYRVQRETKSFVKGELLDTKYRHIKFFLEIKKYFG